MTKKDPYILDRPTGRRLRARDALLCVAVAIVLLVLIEGDSIRNTGKTMKPGIERTAVEAVGEPAGWVADQLPLSDAVDDMTGWLSPDQQLDGPGGFENADVVQPEAGAGAPAAITPDYFDATKLGGKNAQLPRLRKLLVTGDSMSQPLDSQLARDLTGSVETVRDAKLGTGISRTDLVDWGKLSVRHATKTKPDAVVMFIGAGDAYPLPKPGGGTVECCGVEWASLYATRVRRMMDTYRRGGASRVYWLTVPLPRDAGGHKVVTSVNAAFAVAVQPYRSQVRLLDLANVFTPGGKFRTAMAIDGKQTIVRHPDGVHLNAAGAKLAAKLIEARLRADFTQIGE